MSLGKILLVEVRDKIGVPLRDLEGLWRKRGLNEKLLPTQRHPNDAFRKATPRSRRVNGLQLEPYRGPALRDLEMAVVMTRVGDQEALIGKSHRNETVIALDKTGQLHFPYGRPIEEDEQRYLAQIERSFDDSINQVIDGVLVRQAIKAQCLESKGFVIKGGVFMMPHSADLVTEGLIALAKDLNRYLPDNTQPNRTFVVGYDDTPDQRVQLKDHLNHYIRSTIEQQLRELLSYRETYKKIGKRRGSSAVKDLMNLAQLITEYESLLKESLTDLHAYMEIQKTLIYEALEE